MKDILISVVLPIYNVEKYLNQSIESIVNQTYKNLEIILVDDGSPDNCPKMCDEWAQKDDRIKVIHKKNAGLGMARNTGLENATGDYIVFFDSDDYVDTNLFSDMVVAIEKNCAADLIEFGHRRVNDCGDVSYERAPDMPKDLYCGKEVTEVFLPELIGANPYTGKRYGILMTAWCCAYKISTLQKCGFAFVSEREFISEDVYSLLKLMGDINSVLLMDKVYYNYRYNENSLSNVYKGDRFERIVDFYIKAKQLIKEKNYNTEVKMRITAPFLTFVLACLKMEVGNVKQNGLKNTYKRVKYILNNKELNQALSLYPQNQYSIQRKVLQWCMRQKLVWLSIGIIKLK